MTPSGVVSIYYKVEIGDGGEWSIRLYVTNISQASLQFQQGRLLDGVEVIAESVSFSDGRLSTSNEVFRVSIQGTVISARRAPTNG